VQLEAQSWSGVRGGWPYLVCAPDIVAPRPVILVLAVAKEVAAALALRGRLETRYDGVVAVAVDRWDSETGVAGLLNGDLDGTIGREGRPVHAALLLVLRLHGLHAHDRGKGHGERTTKKKRSV